MYYIDLIITIVFTFEVVIKLIGKGIFFCGKRSYFKSVWNILDFTIVLISLISIIFSNDSLKIFKILRMIRVLRPLRVINRNAGLKLVVQTLISAIPNVFSVAIVCFIFYLIMGIFIVSLKKG